MGRKRNPGFYLYPRDIMSSPRCRSLSREAAGVYLFLLCRMSEPPQPGSYRLRDWDRHPTWARSATQKCLATADKYERLQYFARFLAENDLPWEKRQVLESLQELYNKGIIVVEGDMLVQPRMYQDNGFALPDIDRDGAPKDTILDDPASGSMEVVNSGAQTSKNKGAITGTLKGTKNVPENDTFSRARARLSKRVRVGDNNNNNNSKEDSTRENEKTTAKKPAKFTPPTQEEVTAYCQEKGYTFSPVTFFAHYEANGWVQGKGKPIKNWKACCVTWQQREQTGEFSGRSHSHGGTHNDTVQHQHNGGFDDMEGFG